MAHTDCSAEDLQSVYFDVYLRYWEHYHLSLALTGLSASRNIQVIAFGEAALQSVAQNHHDLYGSGLQASEFHTSDTARRLHPEWLERAQPAIDRVEAAWKSVGIPFPMEEFALCW